MIKLVSLVLFFSLATMAESRKPTDTVRKEISCYHKRVKACQSLQKKLVIKNAKALKLDSVELDVYKYLVLDSCLEKINNMPPYIEGDMCGE